MSERKINPFDCEGLPVSNKSKAEVAASIALLAWSIGTSMTGILTGDGHVERFGLAWSATNWIWNFGPIYLQSVRDRFRPF